MTNRRTGCGDSGGYRLPGRVLVATSAYPPIPGGSSVIMKNLLDSIAPECLVLARARSFRSGSGPNGGIPSHFVVHTTKLPSRLERYRQRVLVGPVTRRITQLARSNDCRAILGVYPNIFFLDVAEAAARRAGLPFLAYLHDTVAEGMAGWRFAAWAERVQERVFTSAAAILVATRGMADLYARKYRLEVNTILHIYPESIPTVLPPEDGVQKTFFWGGAVYGINSYSLERVYRAMQRLAGGYRLTVATAQPKTRLVVQGLDGDDIDRIFIPLDQRERYLRTIGEQGVHMLALSWPDESSIHEDELATIFPTKTPEYLASGRPVLVHCPEHYYLARFFRKYECGEVVSDRSPAALDEALRRVTTPGPDRVAMRERALTAARSFARDAVAPPFVAAVESALGDGRA